MLEQVAPDERLPGATFALGDIGFIDFESRSPLPIAVGTDRYARAAQAIVLAWAIGDGPVGTMAVAGFSGSLKWSDMPRELVAFVDRVEKGSALICAHNASFDRAIWNYATDGFPYLEPWAFIDTRVQAAASGLPAKLEHAVKFAGAAIQKDKAGKKLIDLFCLPDSTATPPSHPDEWAAFLRYAHVDVAAMRELFRRTRQLPLAEWREYWAAEAINDGGVMIDLPMVAAAAEMARKDQALAAKELTTLTSGAVTTVNQVKRMGDWLKDILPADGRALLVSQEEEVDLDTGELIKPGKDALDRQRVVRLLAYLDAQETLASPLQAARRLLQIRLYGGSKTPAKFGRMLQSHVDGVIRGQYVFNGASQTGRFSARGIQVHNLARDTLPYEIDAIDALVAGCSPEDLAMLGDDAPISRKLSLLIRPSLVAATGHAFVWGDWANIEARITPWLAKDREAETRLGIFADVDAKVEPYDIYVRTAADISGVSLEEAKAEKIRQRGKVVELACGFGGGANALLSMAASYGMHLSDEDAKAAVDRWRTANPWGPRYWAALWIAVTTALEAPGQFIEVGRIGYIFLREYLGGSLLCRLPSGRFLTYRKIKWELVNEVDDDGRIVDVRRELMFARDMGRVKLWKGLLMENAVQAVAADILRGTLVRLDSYLLPEWMPAVLHTHDEVVCEVVEARAAEAGERLKVEMEAGFAWSMGLPIAADTVMARFYTKSKSSIGL